MTIYTHVQLFRDSGGFNGITKLLDVLVCKRLFPGLRFKGLGNLGFLGGLGCLEFTVC